MIDANLRVTLPFGWVLDYAFYHRGSAGQPKGWYVRLKHDDGRVADSDGMHEINSVQGKPTFEMAIANATEKIDG